MKLTQSAVSVPGNVIKGFEAAVTITAVLQEQEFIKRPRLIS